MKTLTTILTLLTLSTHAQSIITEYSLKGESFGLELTNRRGKGVYFTFGGNYMGQLLSINKTWRSEYNDHFVSSVDWYGPNGAYVPTYSPSVVTTSPDYGNVFLGRGTYRSVSEIITTDYSTVYQTYNAGVVIPFQGFRVRLGGGVFITKNIGKRDYWKITQTGKVEKYYDELKILGNSEHIFVVEYTPTFRDERVITPINETKVLPNLNAAFIIPFYTYETYSTDLILGVNAKTLTVGLSYTF